MASTNICRECGNQSPTNSEPEKGRWINPNVFYLIILQSHVVELFISCFFTYLIEHVTKNHVNHGHFKSIYSQVAVWSHCTAKAACLFKLNSIVQALQRKEAGNRKSREVKWEQKNQWCKKKKKASVKNRLLQNPHGRGWELRHTTDYSFLYTKSCYKVWFFLSSLQDHGNQAVALSLKVDVEDEDEKLYHLKSQRSLKYSKQQ